MKLVRAAFSLAQAQLAGRLGERQLRRLQEAKLRRIVAHASATVPFYQSFWKSHGVDPAGVRRLEDLRHLPVVTKAQLQAADEEARLSRAYERQALIVKRTSGSTGRPMTLFRDARFEERQKLRFLHTLLAGGLAAVASLAAGGRWPRREPLGPARLALHLERGTAGAGAGHP